MTGGGPGGATRLYSILAYEKAIGSLQYGPGTRDRAQRRAADGAAHLAAREDPSRRTTARSRSGAGRGLGASIAGAAARAWSWLLDMIVLPFDLAFRGGERLAGWAARLITGQPERPVFNSGQRERWQMYMRLLVLLPIMVFVLFPFYWVVVTSFKTTPQISARTSIFWPDPATHRAVPLAAAGHAVPDLVRQFGAGGGGQHRDFGSLRGARRLCPVAAQVPRSGAADDRSPDHLPAAGNAAVHTALPDPQRARADQHLWRPDLDLSDLPDAVRDLGADRLFQDRSRSNSRRRR